MVLEQNISTVTHHELGFTDIDLFLQHGMNFRKNEDILV